MSCRGSDQEQIQEKHAVDDNKYSAINLLSQSEGVDCEDLTERSKRVEWQERLCEWMPGQSICWHKLEEIQLVFRLGLRDF